MLLDELGDVPASAQVKLLRTIEHREITPVGDARPRPVNVRFLAATNRPLDALMTSGAFREDLFFRLSVFPIHVPPLRDRREDIPELAARFLANVTRASDATISLRDDVVRELMARSWSGNVRELRNAVERAAIVARGPDIRVEHLPPPARPDSPSSRAPERPASQPAHRLARSRDAQSVTVLRDRTHPLRSRARSGRAATAGIGLAPEPRQPCPGRAADRHSPCNVASKAEKIRPGMRTRVQTRGFSGLRCLVGATGCEAAAGKVLAERDANLLLLRNAGWARLDRVPARGSSTPRSVSGDSSASIRVRAVMSSTRFTLPTSQGHRKGTSGS